MNSFWKYSSAMRQVRASLISLQVSSANSNLNAREGRQNPRPSASRYTGEISMSKIKYLSGCLLILCILPALSCLRAMPAERKATFNRYINELVNAPLKNLGENLASVQSKLGTPSALSTERLRNRHDPNQTDQIHTLTYKGLVVRIYDVPAFKKEMLLTVRLAENRPGLLPELIGQSEKAIKDKFGDPTGVEGAIYKYVPVYNVDEPGEDVVKIQFNNSSVSSVEWNYYVD